MPKRIALPDSGRQTTVTPPDLFDLALRGEIPNLVLAGIQRLLLATAVGAGIATAEERAAFSAESDGAGALELIRYLIEDATSEPKLVAELDRARELSAQGVAVDLQHRYSQRDLFFVYDHALDRGGRFYRAMFPDAAPEPAPAAMGVVLADAADGDRAEPAAQPGAGG